MSVLVENEAGWLVSHQREINNAYTTTFVFENYRLRDSLRMKADSVSESGVGYSLCRFEAVPELFAIHHTYVMDTHFAKSTKTNQTSDNFDQFNSALELADHSVILPALRPNLDSKVIVFFLCLYVV